MVILFCITYPGSFALSQDHCKPGLFRTATYFWLNPIDSLGQLIKSVYYKTQKMPFDHLKYKNTLTHFQKIIEQGSEIQASDIKDTESIIAYVEISYQLAKKDHLTIANYFKNNSDSKILYKTLAAITHENPKAIDAKKISRAIYAFTRRIPTDQTEYLNAFFSLSAKNNLAKIIDYQAELIFIEHSLETLSKITGKPISTPKQKHWIKSSLGFLFKISMNLFGADTEAFVLRSLKSEPFQKRILEVGYQKAFQEFEPEFTKELKTKIRIDRIVKLLGIITSSYFMIELLDCLIPDQMPEREKMIETIMIQWQKDQFEVLGFWVDAHDQEYKNQLKATQLQSDLDLHATIESIRQQNKCN